MNSPADDITLLLEAEGVGTTDLSGAWALATAAEPELPDDCATVYDTGGEEPDTDELDVERPTIQIRVRSKDYQAAYEKQRQIRDILILPATVEADTSIFIGIFASSEIISIGRDEKERYVLTANYRCIRTTN